MALDLPGKVCCWCGSSVLVFITVIGRDPHEATVACCDDHFDKTMSRLGDAVAL